jgi:hypothetical protein
MLQIKLPNTEKRWKEWSKINSSLLEVIELQAPWEATKVEVCMTTSQWLVEVVYTPLLFMSYGKRK